MALSQQKFREIVFQLLYSQDMGRPDEAEMIRLIMAELAVSKKNVRLAQDQMHLIMQKLAEIDTLISSVSTSYDFARIQTVTKNILRLGVFEIFFNENIPPKVAIAEAIRLSRKFSSPESANFVNALLDHLYQDSKGDKADPQIFAQQLQVLEESEQAASDYSLEIPLIDETDQEGNLTHENS